MATVDPEVEITPSGTKKYRLNGKLHREDGSAIEYADGEKEWYIHGKRHREDGPAVEYADTYKEWYIHGKLHRLDGPAVEYADGGKYWFYHGVKISCNSQKEFLRLIKLLPFK